MAVDPTLLEVAERYRLQTRRDADALAVNVADAHDELGARYAPIAAAAIAAANLRAGAHGVRYVATAGLLVRGAPVDLTRLDLVDDWTFDMERLARAARTASDHGRPAVIRLARSEPLRAGQLAVSRAMERARLGWTRVAGAGACPICSALADGTVLAATTPMARPHPTCSCTQAPAEFPKEER
jgi:hypothetical protein